VKKKIFTAFLCVVLAGCSAGGIKYKNNIIEDNTTEYSIYIEEPSISGLDNEYTTTINSEFTERSKAFSEDFKSRIPQYSSEKCELSCVSEAKFCSNDFISIVTEKNVYTGGAHGNLWKIADNIDARYKKKINLSDLFIDSNYIEFINMRIEELIKENPEEYCDLWQKPQITDRHQEDFYISEGNIVIFYQPYDLSYYAKGIIEFPISIESLRGYIKPEYTERLI